MSDSIQESLAASVLRLGDECRDLAISNAVLRQENEELHKDYEALADEHTKLIEKNARLKAEVEAHEKRWAESEDLISHYKQQRDEAINDCKCSRLKAEVERLNAAILLGAIIPDAKPE